MLVTLWGQSVKSIGSISVSGQLLTYPSPNPTLTLTCYQLTVVRLGEGQVGSCPDTDIDPVYPPSPFKKVSMDAQNVNFVITFIIILLLVLL